MGKYDKFHSAKDHILRFIKTELVGPVEESEVLDVKPLDAYVAGVLWAQRIKPQTDIEEENQAEADRTSEAFDGPIFSEEDKEAVPEHVEPEEGTEEVLHRTGKRKPSAMGLSFQLDKRVTRVGVAFSFAKYVHSEELRQYGEEGKVRTFHLYTRQPYRFEGEFDFSKEEIVLFPESKGDSSLLKEMGIDLRATRRAGHLGEKRLVTVSVSNEKIAQSQDIVLNENALFQCELTIFALDGTFCPLNSREFGLLDIEDEVLEMQYKDVLSYAQGHGCAADWEVSDGICKKIRSEFVPVSEVRQMKPPEVENKRLFTLRYLYEGARDEVVCELGGFLGLYHDWFLRQKKVSEGEEYRGYKRAVAHCFEKIAVCEGRIREGIRILSKNDTAWKAFIYANRAMYLQRINMALVRGKIDSEEEFAAKMSEPAWYPFQLFYLLMIVPDFVDPASRYKDTVDLLWFPTGGGKTEAYFAVAAFLIFYERLTDRREKYGTTILMRYTLRLLTTQQFERAAALICACDRVRKESKMGGNSISIGLWIGSGSTPNTVEDAQESLRKLYQGERLNGSSNPVQLTKCPSCGKVLNASHYSIEKGQMVICCPHCGRLPVYIVDTDIYEAMPTLVISTVDKFARIVWEEKSGRLFGCNVDTNKPKLIIQDELHLISGPLGTLTGLYEAAIDRLCYSEDGSKPKIIASTATVKNAGYQIKGLYNRDFFQFPPSGLNYKDSFFAVEASKDERPSRYYIGLSEQGGNMIDLMIRVFASLCVVDYYFEKHGVDRKVVDQYYTIVGYFNAIKELGTAATVIQERMYSYIGFLLNVKFAKLSEKLGLAKNEHGKYELSISMRNGELTSRRSSVELREILDALNIVHNSDPDEERAYKYILSSNMFSVGVDIDRLGLMAVYSQPKSNADYIQATSRVGRSNPGVVVCMYNAFRTRDRSYYEQFIPYHQCFYKYVEATSVTPFSRRSIEKGLHSVFVALVRHLVPGMERNAAAANFSKNDRRVLQIMQYLLNRIAAIQGDAEEYSKAYLERFADDWDRDTEGLVYDSKREGRKAGAVRSLLLPAENSEAVYPVMNSVRNVENSSNVYIDIGEL